VKKVVCIFGATSTGKSALAVEVALACGGEIVSADSMQVYRGLDIGTGKATAAEQRGVPHHLLDVCEPTEKYSAGRFQRDADAAIDAIIRRGGQPIVTGGTGLYFRALLRGLAPVGPPDRALRERLHRRKQRRGIAAMHGLLRRLDPETAARLPVNDTQRILRALEYRLSTGRKLSAAIAAHPFGGERYDVLKIGLSMDRAALRSRIDRRVDAMFDAGWIGEVKRLLEAGVPPDCHALRAIGYREIVKFLQKEVTIREAIDMIKTATHQYAKRQDTWFRKEKDVHWLDARELEKNKQKAMELLRNQTK
jgi:tRNA dimethylallyltransferase